MSDLFLEGTEKVIYIQIGFVVVFVLAIGFVIGLPVGVAL